MSTSSMSRGSRGAEAPPLHRINGCEHHFFTHSPGLDAAPAHVTAFAEMMCGRQGDRLDEWLAAVEADTLTPLQPFATGLRRDYDAVRAGLILEHTPDVSKAPSTRST